MLQYSAVQVIVVLSACVCLSVCGTPCSPSRGLDTFNPECTKSSEPYCVRVVGLPAAVYECRECVNNCDCDVSQYCSSKPGQVGECKSLKREGDSCRPLSTAQLTDRNFPEKWKCADLYEDESGNLVVDQSGVCIDGTCRQCAPRGTVGGGQPSGMPSCLVDAGRKVERTCTYPGQLTNTHRAAWSPGYYYENPEHVWWAIFFVLLLTLVAVQITTLIFFAKK